MSYLTYQLLEGLTPLNILIALFIFLVFLGSILLARTIIRRLLDRWGSRRKFAPYRTMVEEINTLIYAGIMILGAYMAVVSIPVVRDFYDLVRRAFSVAAIVLIFVSLIRAQGTLFDWYQRRQQRRAAARMIISVLPLFKRSAAVSAMVLGALMIMGQLGIQIAPILAGLGIGGIAVALALQSTLANFFSGVSILSDGTLQVGDLVELEDGLRSWVMEIGWRATKIRTIDNNVIIVPNSKLAETQTINYNYGTEQIDAIVLYGVAYFTDLRRCREVTHEIAKAVIEKTEGAIKSFDPVVVFTGFGDSNIDVRVVMRARDWQARWNLVNNFVMDVMERYEQEGLEISFPNRNLWLRDARGGYLARGEEQLAMPDDDKPFQSSG